MKSSVTTYHGHTEMADVARPCAGQSAIWSGKKRLNDVTTEFETRGLEEPSP